MTPARFEEIYDIIAMNFYMAYMFNNDDALHNLYGNIKLLKAYCKLQSDPFYNSFLTEINLLKILYKNI